MDGPFAAEVGGADERDGRAPQGPDAAPVIASGTHVLLDTDANNELDDQHALAYLLFSADRWHIDGVTTNRTDSGGSAQDHLREAQTVAKLCASPTIPVLLGPDPKFLEIRDRVSQADYPGRASVEFIIQQAKHHGPQNRLIVIAIGKLTNVALALLKDPAITPSIRLVWLGSNWPSDTPEYNQWGDWTALEYILEETDVAFEMAVVRYGRSDGAEGVRVTRTEIRRTMPGLGPKVAPVTGRHGGSFTTFGDYSVNLFDHIGAESRALYDVAAVAVVKNPAWARAQEVGAPAIERSTPSNPQSGGKFVPRPDNPRKMRVYDQFDRAAIIGDFFATMRGPRLQRSAP